MAISESKKKIVIENYFKKECDVNTSIKEAFTKGFELGLEKAPMPQPKMGHWIFHEIEDTLRWYECDQCGVESVKEYDYCHGCGARMVESQNTDRYYIVAESEGKE